MAEWTFFTPASLIFTFLLVQLTRVTTRRLLPYSIYQFIGEFLCTFQLVTCVYENGMHLKQFGTVTYAIGLFSLSLGYSLTFDALGNPAAIFERMVKRKITVINGVLKIVMQVLAGLCAYKYITTLWTLMAPSGAHLERLHGVFAGACTSHLKVGVVTGMVCEGIAMFVCRSVAGAGIGGRYYNKVVNAFTTVVVVLSGLNWTGMNVNPALATAATYNCKGHTLPEHILVYWIGPFIGVLASIALFNYLVEEDSESLGVTLKQVSTDNEKGQGDSVSWKNGGAVPVTNGVRTPHENGAKHFMIGIHRGSKKIKRGSKGKRGNSLRRRSGAKMSSG